MADRRRKDVIWAIADELGDIYGGIKGGAQLAVLMDIRDELKKLNAVFACPNFTAVPRILRRISANTAKPKRKKRNV